MKIIGHHQILLQRELKAQIHWQSMMGQPTKRQTDWYISRPYKHLPLVVVSKGVWVIARTNLSHDPLMMPRINM
jgi:hypothetical protein